MPSNTGEGNSVVSSGCAAGAVGDTECAAEAQVSLGFAFSAEVSTNCARLDENAVAASYVEAAGDGFISRGGLTLGSLDAQVTKDPSQLTAGISFVGVGVVCSSDKIQGDAGGADEILLGQKNADISSGAINAEVVGAVQTCNNVNDHTHKSSSPLSNQSRSLEEESVCSPVPTQKARQYFKKRPRKLCRQLYRGGSTDRKISSVDHANYRATRNTDNPPSTVASRTANRGHSPTKEEVKKTNQRLLEENLRLKKDFHKANHRLKTLLADKRDLLRRLRLESKTSNNLIEQHHTGSAIPHFS